MNGKSWTAEDLALLRREYPDTPTAQTAAALGRTLAQTYSKAGALGLKKSERYLASPDACRLRRGDNIGAAHRFLPGHVPANKGLRRPGWHAGRMRETQFKKGALNGRAARLYKSIGTERLSKEGYRQRKVTNDLRGAQRWKHVHVLLWVDHYGPIPPGYAVGFIDGDKTNIEIGNLMLLSRTDLMRLNTIHRYPQELRLAIRQVARLKRVIERRSSEKQD